MRIECPECRFSAEVDPTRIPGRGKARCPACGAHFDATPPNLRPPYVVPQPDVPSDRLIPPRIPDSFGVGRNEIIAWLREGRIAARDLPQAAEVAGFLPDASAWRRFLDTLALWCGALFCALSVIFFFAYNWQDLGRCGRFVLVEAPLVASAFVAWRLSLERAGGRAALTVSTLLVGSLLALVGQTYQTGADPWELFAVWAFLVLPWVAIARFTPLWLLWIALLNLATVFYYQVTAGRMIGGLLGTLFSPEGIWWSLLFLNAMALTFWEAAARHWSWLSGRWAARCVATIALIFATSVALLGIFDDNDSGAANLIVYFAAIVAGYAVYRRRLRDLYCLALGVLSLIVVTASFLSKHLFDHGDAGAFFLIGNLIVGLSALGGWWLRTVAREDTE